jgi:hypothetical protein
VLSISLATPVEDRPWVIHLGGRLENLPNQPRKRLHTLYRGFKPKPGGTLGYNIIVVPNRL